MTDNLPRFSLETAIKKAEEKKGRETQKAMTFWLDDLDVQNYDKLQTKTKLEYGKYLKGILEILIRRDAQNLEKAS